MPSIFLIEDNEDLLANLYAWLEPLGYLLDCARNGREALERLESTTFDCIILDIMLPGIDGFTLCSRLRAKGDMTPLIMLTARDSVEDRIKGLEIGADDYLIKPFSLAELETRIRAVLRRTRSTTASILAFEDIELDPGRAKATRGGLELKIGPKGMRILACLLKAAPNVVRREDLEKLLWGDELPSGSALRNHIMELRRSLNTPGSKPILQTVPHIGYYLSDAPL